MPEQGKKSMPTEPESKSARAPAVSSPSKSKAALNDKPAKDPVKLPSLTTPPASPAKKNSSAKGDAKTTLPSKDGSKASMISTSKTPIAPIVPKATKPSQPKPTRVPTLDTMPPSDSAHVEVPDEIPSEASEPSNGPTLDAIASTSNSTSEEARAADEAAVAVAAGHAQAEAEEAERIRKERGNGMVKLIYEQYDELFPIVDGSTTQANIDEVYCLSFVMPNCLVRLSYHPNAERFERENTGTFDSLVREDPRGVYQDLIKDETYYVVVEQEADQLRRDQEATKVKWAPEIKQDKLSKDDGRGFESCSCIYGNPCVDEYGCKDWHSRFAIATANGWKGF
ncbi:hypothetical protein Poli38472_003190 [Pythium oligandrum]|uniref:Uncharacterized protein n=1 Tax=Pythium oligandrum TaxID=41045 RepID=A0A8K1C6C9_PYTOL|nr:hypothetical protein Poli38472_003190 [Pythium oligandrum]|eukprot:TMW57265.1 hypothetical protein Poli38472_003190 [Pythium oligandrum]